MKIILIPLLLVSISGLGAQTPQDPIRLAINAYTLSSSASFGFLYGQSEEQVYKDEERLLSQLLWDIKPLFYYGSSLELSPRKPLQQWGLFAALSFRFGFPGKTGIMEDRDWKGTGDELTDFSSHNNYTRAATLADAAIGVSIPIASFLAIKASLTYSYMFFTWSGRDGYGDYSTGHLVYSGAVINFSQNWHLVSGSIAVSFPFLDVFSVSAALQVGTVVSYNALDDHLTNNKQFIDTACGGLLLEPRFEFTWSPLDKLSVALSAGYRYISAFMGISVYSQQGSGSTSSSTFQDAGVIGAAYSVWDAGLSFKVHF